MRRRRKAVKSDRGDGSDEREIDGKE